MMYTRDEVDRVFKLARAIKHPFRQKMLETILNAGELNVTDLYIKLRCEQSVASQQLSILLAANLVKTRREGKFVFYSINEETKMLIDQIIIEIEELGTV